MKKGQHPKALAIPPFLHRNTTGETDMYMAYINDETELLQGKKIPRVGENAAFKFCHIMVNAGEPHYE